MPKDQQDSGLTGELFEVSQSKYKKLLAGSQSISDTPFVDNKHIWAAPPATKQYLTQCGVEVPVPKT